MTAHLCAGAARARPPAVLRLPCTASAVLRRHTRAQRTHKGQHRDLRAQAAQSGPGAATGGDASAPTRARSVPPPSPHSPAADSAALSAQGTRPTKRAGPLSSTPRRVRGRGSPPVGACAPGFPAPEGKRRPCQPADARLRGWSRTCLPPLPLPRRIAPVWHHGRSRRGAARWQQTAQRAAGGCGDGRHLRTGASRCPRRAPPLTSSLSGVARRPW